MAIKVFQCYCIAIANVPINLVDNAEFQGQQLLDPHYVYNLPHRKKVGFEINKLYDNLKSKFPRS